MAHRALERLGQLRHHDLHRTALAYARQIGFKHLGHHIHGLRVTNHEQCRAGLSRITHHGLAFSHDAGTRCTQFDAITTT